MPIKVKAAPGLKVPKENDPRTYFGEEPEDAEATPYIVRRLATGELLDAEGEAGEPAKSTRKAVKT